MPKYRDRETKFNPLAVKEIRKREKLTQQDLAISLRCSIETVRGWEYGRNEPNGYYIDLLYRKYILAGHEDIEFYT